MTHAIDKFLIDHGFEDQELKDITYRPVLYLGILIAGLLAVTFSSLAVLAWT